MSRILGSYRLPQTREPSSAWARFEPLTLFMVSDGDVAPQILVVDHLHSLIPGSKKVLIRGADHVVNMSNPEEFNKTVLDFLNSQKIAITN